MVLLDRKLYIEYLNKLDSKERVIVTRANGLKSYGFNDVFEQDGVEISTEYSVPTGCGYGLSIANMELHCMEGSLMTAEGPFYNEDLQSYRYVVSVLANLKFRSPRNFFKLAAIA
jgi:pantoate kinase